MASFDENGKYIKTNWKAGDKITSTKLNKIEESIEAVNDNDISRHVEADARLDALEAKDATHDKELTKIKNDIADNKAAAELGDYEINSRMTFLENELNEGIEEVHNVAETVDGKIATAEANMTSAVTTAKDEMTTQVNTAKNNMAAQVNAAQAEMTTQVNTAKDEMTAQVNQGKADMEAMVAEVEAEMIELQNDVSEIQDDVSEIQNDMTNAQTQSFTVSDSYKFTLNHDEMMTSLVTLNNVEGLSSVESNMFNAPLLVSRYLKHICTVDTSKNYFEDATDFVDEHNATHTLSGNTLNVSGPYGWSAVKCRIANLVRGRKYCVTCDNIQINKGGSAFQCLNGTNADLSLPQTMNSRYLNESGFSYVFIYDVRDDIVRFHCALGNESGGDVTYENIQIYEVKEMIVPNIQLNSLPNGVKDEIKDGVLIKRTGYIPLNALQWNESSTNADYPDSPFKVFWATLDDIKLHVGDDKIILCNTLECKPQAEHTASADNTGSTAISGSPIKHQVRIKLYRYNIPDLTSLNAWLASDNVYIVYELAQPEFIELSTAIKADKNDTIIVNTCKPLDFTYDIQCSTRAQIDALQDLNHQYLNHQYLPLSGGTITGDLTANCFESIRTVESADGGGAIGSITKTQAFTDQYGQARFNIENNLTNSPLTCIANPHDCSFSVNGDFKPAGGYTCDLGSSTNRWNSIYSYPFKMFVEDNSYTSRLQANRGNFRLVDAYDVTILSWSHDHYMIGPDVTNSINLGNSDYRFKSLYLNAQPNVSSDRTLKENIQYVKSNESNVSYQDMYAFVKDDLELATYNLVDHDKLNMGFIAQDLLANLDGTDNKVGQMIVNPVPVPTAEEMEEGKPYPTLSYDTGMYTSVLAGALKEAINKIEQLEARINELENK